MTVTMTHLNSGFKIITDCVPTVETVSLGVWVGVGARNETQEVNGIAHVLEHMAFKGTKNRTAFEIANQIEAVGGYMNAYTDRESTAYHIRVLKEDVPLAVEILADILQYSTFDEGELERERSVILQEIGQAFDTPDDIVFDYFQKTCFPDHPIGWPILGHPDVIQSLQSKTVESYMKSHYSPSRMVFAAAGNLSHRDLASLVEKHFTSFSNSSLPPSDTLPRYKGGDMRQERDLEQVHIVLGFEGIPFGHKDEQALTLLSSLLGGGMSSRLFQEVREKQGLVYTIYSYATCYKDTGIFGIYAGTGEDEVKELFPIICEQLRILPTSLKNEEIDRTKSQLKASLLMGLESMSNRCERLANHLLSYGRFVPLEESIQRIEAVQKSDLEDLSQRLFKTRPTLTTLGPIRNIPSFDQICRDLLS